MPQPVSTLPTLIALLLGYAVFRVANIFVAIWNDVNFRFRMASTASDQPHEPDP